MIPIDQTHFGPRGNCLSACVASLLHLAIYDVTNWGEVEEGWHDRFSLWLGARGLYPVTIDAKPEVNSWRPTGLHILAGLSPRGDWLHAVVARGHDIIHDPHWSRAGLVRVADATMLVALDPLEGVYETRGR